MKLIDLGEPKSFLHHVYLGCTQRESKSNESAIHKYESLPHHLKSYLFDRNRRRKLPLVIMTRKVMLKSPLKGVVNWLIKRQSNCIRSQHHVSTTISSKRKNWKRWENCQKHAFKLS